MKTSLLKGLDEDAKKELKGLFVQSLPLRKALINVLNDKRKSTQDIRLSLDDYANNSWAYKQSELNGYERAITELISLLEN